VKPILIVPLLGITFLFPVAAQDVATRSTRTPGQTSQLSPAQREAMNELNEATRLYREGHFAEAQQHSEKALALNPLSKTAPLFLARTIHAQYKPGDRSEINVAKAREAIDAYKRVLVQNPRHEEAYKAVAYLYAALKDDELLRQWVLQRAIDSAISAEKRAEAFVVLASKDWDCSFMITELPTNKTTLLEGRSVKIQYTMPKDVREFDKARQCAANGLALIESAISLKPDDEAAWSYKTNLLLELSKLAEMENNFLLKAEYERQADAARNTLFEFVKRKSNNSSAKP
jgi:tetratricopeptide (TPR) repeat protein